MKLTKPLWYDVQPIIAASYQITAINIDDDVHYIGKYSTKLNKLSVFTKSNYLIVFSGNWRRINYSFQIE